MFSQIRSFLDVALRRRRFEREMEAELQSHIEAAVEDRVARGVPRAEAESQARRAFGTEYQVKEECRQSRGLALLDAFQRDSVYAFRMLRRCPAFTATAILSLAFGIGVNTAIFSIIDALILRPLPVPHPEQLVILNALEGMPFQAARELQRQSHSLSAIVTPGSDRPVAVEHDGGVEAGSDYEVSANFFSTLGIQPAMGRLIATSDDAPPGVRPAAVVVLGYRYWQREFHTDPHVLGKTIRIEGAEFTIIGVTEKKYVGTYIETAQDISTILGALDLGIGHPDPRLMTAPLRVMARLAPGISASQSQAELKTIWPAILAATSPAKQDRHRQIDFQSGAGGYSYLREGMRPALAALMGLSFAVLLIACLNLANLLLARAAARTRELGIRTAIGADPGTLLRQMLTESWLLSVAGTVAGFCLGNWLGQILAVSAWRGVAPLRLNFTPDMRTAGFAGLLAFASTMLIGVPPALRILRMDPARALCSRLWISDARTSRWTQMLTVMQVAMSLVLVLAAGLFARTLANLQNRDFGFSRDHLLATLKFAHQRPATDPIAYWQQLEASLEHNADIMGAAMASFPLTLSGGQGEASRSDSSAAPVRVYAGIVTPGFFRVLGLPVIKGREFSSHDDRHATAAAMISQTLARRLFAGQDPLGRRIDLTAGRLRNVEIVGVVHDTLAGPRDLAPAASVYLAAYQLDNVSLPWLIVRTHGDPSGAAAAVRAALNSGGREYPFFVKTGRELNAPILERMIATLAAGYGILALLLAAIGLYGTVSYGVSRRTMEIGIRLALGAQRRAVVRLFVREVGVFVAAGLVLGSAISLFAGHTIAALLFGVRSNDLLTLSSALAILLGVGLGAAVLPAWQAVRLDPAAALRRE
jgi:predicted permease